MNKIIHFIGSCPPFPHGWHLIILLKDKLRPLIMPYFCKASCVYFEQVGVYLHEGGLSGDIIS